MITIYTKENCGVCDSAKQKFSMMGLSYQIKNLEHTINSHDGWRDDNSESLLAAYALFNNRIPIIEIDGQWFDYPGAMRRLKGGE